MPIVVPPGSGRSLGGRFDVTIKVRGEDTGGAVAVIEETLPARALISVHTHANDVWVYILEGEVGVLVGDEIAAGCAGSWLLKPRNIPHAMWNAASEPARIVEVLTPAGSEQWFEEISRLEADDEPGFVATCRRHGIDFLPNSPWNGLLREKYGL